MRIRSLNLFLRLGFALVVSSASNANADENFLSDPKGRIASQFKVSPLMQRRVGFWFDVYTKYPSTHHVIHHTRYPWIVYEVVDTSDFYRGNAALWLKQKRARNHVRVRRQAIVRALKRLTAHPTKKLSSLEHMLVKQLKPLRGSRGSVYRFASQSVRSQTGQKNFFLAGLKSSTKYMNHMEDEFKKHGLPVELLRIPFVESSFNEKAQSRVGASGIWQIMPHIGRAYLTVSKYIDERNSPLKATVVAAKILRQNHRIFKQWPLAITAYNHGIGGLRKSLVRAKKSTLEGLISNYRGGTFGFASANFYASFLAALHAEQYQKEIFSEELPRYLPSLSVTTVRLQKALRPKVIAMNAGIDIEVLGSLNPDIKGAIKDNYILPKGFTIVLPAGARMLTAL